MRPDISITGHRTVEVTEQEKNAFLRQLQVQGIVLLNKNATKVWAATEVARDSGMAYDVNLIKDAAGEVQEIAVINTQCFIDLNIPKDWKMEVVESYIGFGDPCITRNSSLSI